MFPISRSHLQGIPALRKHQYVENLFHEGWRYSNIMKAAEAGETSCTFVILNQRNPLTGQTPPTLTKAEWISACEKLFPECTISYEEVYEKDMPGGKIMTWRITIDWS